MSNDTMSHSPTFFVKSQTETARHRVVWVLTVVSSQLSSVHFQQTGHLLLLTLGFDSLLLQTTGWNQSRTVAHWTIFLYHSHAHIHANTLTHVHTDPTTHARSRTHTHTCTHRPTDTRTHARTHTHTRARARAHDWRLTATTDDSADDHRDANHNYWLKWLTQ